MRSGDCPESRVMMHSSVRTSWKAGVSGIIERRCANQAAMVFEIHVTLAGGSTMIMDAVEVFVIDDDARIAGLSAYWDMSRARTRA